MYATLPAPCNGAEISEILPLAAVLRINDTHNLLHRVKERELGGLSNADHLSLPATALKPLPPIRGWLLWKLPQPHSGKDKDGVRECGLTEASERQDKNKRYNPAVYISDNDPSAYFSN